MRTVRVIIVWCLWFAFLAVAAGALLILPNVDAGPNSYRRANHE